MLENRREKMGLWDFNLRSAALRNFGSFPGIIFFVSLSSTMGPKKVKGRRHGNKDGSKHKFPSFFIRSINRTALQVIVNRNNTTMRTWKRRKLLLLPEMAGVKAHISQGLVKSNFSAAPVINPLVRLLLLCGFCLERYSCLSKAWRYVCIGGTALSLHPNVYKWSHACA